MERNTFIAAVFAGAIVGAVIAGCYGYFDHIETQLSIYGGPFEDYAWGKVKFGLNGDEISGLVLLTVSGGLIGAASGAAGAYAAKIFRP